MKDVIFNMLLWIFAFNLIEENISLYSNTISVKATYGSINITCKDLYSINITGVDIDQHDTCTEKTNSKCTINSNDLSGIKSTCNEKKTCNYDLVDIKDCNSTETLTFRVSYGCLEGSNIEPNSYCGTITDVDTLKCNRSIKQIITTVTNVNVLTTGSHCDDCKCENLQNDIFKKTKGECENKSVCVLDYHEIAIKYECIIIPTYVRVAYTCLLQEEYEQEQISKIDIATLAGCVTFILQALLLIVIATQCKKCDRCPKLNLKHMTSVPKENMDVIYLEPV